MSEAARVDVAQVAESRIISAAQAICEATAQALEHDDRVIVMGEGVTDPKAVFGTTSGLVERFGRARVLEMPIAENGWTGVAVGAAMTGMRPILVHQRVEFALLAVEQLFNNAAKAHYVTAGRHRVPLVVRMVIGRGWGQGPMHSQALEGLFAQIPGLVVAMPANAYDAKLMLLAGVAADHPVVLLEHRWVHYATGHVPLEMPAEGEKSGLAGPRRMRTGDAATVVATSYMCLEADQAAQALAEQGCDVELFDLRVLRPLQIDAIVASVRRTGRLLTIDTGHRDFGIGSEICARVTERAWSEMRAAPLRMGLPDHPTPSSPSLAERYYPRSPAIVDEIARLVGLDSSKAAACRTRLMAARENLPLDIPHPSFRGPF